MRAASGDPPGDPAMLRFREAVAAGAIPFTVQGPENVLCLDGGRTIGWEVGEQLVGSGRPAARPDRSCRSAVAPSPPASVAGCTRRAGRPALQAVQTAGCAPLARAWRAGGGHRLSGGVWPTLMTPWEIPQSLADGILDDETYDWIGVFDAIAPAAGRRSSSPRTTVVEAHELAHRAGFDVEPDRVGGLAGLIGLRGELDPTERVAVVMSGVTR